MKVGTVTAGYELEKFECEFKGTLCIAVYKMVEAPALAPNHERDTFGYQRVT